MKIVRLTAAVLVFMAAVAFFAVRVGDHAPVGETATERAHRVCTTCGLSCEAVDGLIGATSDSVLSREGLIELWEATYADPDKLEQARSLCQPCVNAILAAVAESGE